MDDRVLDESLEGISEKTAEYMQEVRDNIITSDIVVDTD